MGLFDKNETLTNHIGISAYNIKDLSYANLLTEAIKRNVSTLARKTQISCTVSDFADYVKKAYPEPVWQTIQTAYNGGLIIHRLTRNFVEYVSNDNESYISVFGDLDFIEGNIAKIEVTFPKEISIEWYYSPQESPSTVYIDMSKLPIDEMYPNLDVSLETYYQEFISSDANILILIGPPGTGKTSFLRGLISHYEGAKPLVTYDPKILDTDGFFNTFVTGSSNLLIIEDADNFLTPRASGNDMITRFLNIGSGLISVKGKKIIFSTNLPSIKDIDEALIRPGRCHDILHFDRFTVEQGEKLISKMPFLNIPEGRDEFTLAEMFGENNSKNTTKKVFGFV